MEVEASVKQFLGIIKVSIVNKRSEKKINSQEGVGEGVIEGGEV